MQASSRSSTITSFLWLAKASCLSRSTRSLPSSSIKCSTKLPASNASWRTQSNVVTLTRRSPLTAYNSSLANYSLSSATLKSFWAFFSLSYARALTVEACFRSDLCFTSSLVGSLTLSSKAGLLGGQGGNLSFIRLSHPGGALVKAGPPSQALHVSSHLPKNNK